MRQLYFLSPGALEWREVEAPAIQGPGEAIVRPLAVAACDLDLAVLRGLAPIPGPYAFGHECAAEVVEVGPDVTRVAPGDRVVVAFQIFCGTCDRCLRGLTANCTAAPPGSMYGFGALGGERWGGAFADLLHVPFADAMLTPIPAPVATAVAANVSDNLSDAWRTVAPLLEREPGAEVLVVGGFGQSIGLWAVEMSLALGATKVDYVDDDESRAAIAQGYGAGVVDPGDRKRVGRYPITVDASGLPDRLALSLRSTAPGGTCTSIGVYMAPETPIPLLEMYATGITFTTGRPHCGVTVDPVVDLLARGAIHPETIVTEVDWEGVDGALTDPPLKLVATRP